MHMSKNNIFKENFQRYIDGFYSKNELESILKQIKNYCTDEDIDQLAEQLWSNLGDETLANRFEKATCEKKHGNYWLNPNVSNVWRKSDALSIIAFLQLHWFS